MTSNLGSEYLTNGINEEAKEKVNLLLKNSFRPEFLNRIDEIILFHPLTKEVQMKIVQKLLNDLQERLLRNNIKFTFTDAVARHVLEESYNTTYGARPIKRYIQKNIETLIAHDIISSHILPNVEYRMDYQNGMFEIK